MSTDHEVFMREALALAIQAGKQDEVPVGAVVVHDGEIIGRGCNWNIQSHDATAHAEIGAIREAGLALKNHRLVDCDLYVTLEPCVMCAGAIVHARIRGLIFATRDEKAGAAGSIANLLESPMLNHQCKIVSGVLDSESQKLLRTFFFNKRT